VFLVREQLLCPGCTVASELARAGLDCGGWMPTGVVRASNDTGVHEIVRRPG
jgi:hypothetical protein